MSIFNIFARIDLDSSKFEAGLKRADSALVGLGRTAAKYFTAGAIGYGLLNLGRQAFQLGGEIADLADQLGITTDEVQSLQKAARESGIDLNTYAAAVVKVKKAQADALSGNKNAQGMFSALGVSPKSGVLDILRAAGGAKTPEQLSAAYDLIGTKAGKIQSSLATLHALGPAELISAENAAALDKAGDTIAQIKNDMLVIAAKSMESTLGFWSNALENANKTNPRTGKPYGVGAGLYLTMAESMGDRAINKKYDALPLPDEAAAQFGEFNWGGGVGIGYGRKRRKLEQEMIGAMSDPSGLAFQSSSQNDRSRIGGYWMGADTQARQDLARQSLEKQTIMADRLDKIERKIAELETN